MANRVEVLLVGKTPIGSAIRAGLFGVIATWISGWFFRADWQAAALGALIVIVALPIAYLISSRDDPPAAIPSEPGTQARDRQMEDAPRTTAVPPTKPDAP